MVMEIAENDYLDDFFFSFFFFLFLDTVTATVKL